jgi:ABC-type nitrate/sulfonate/bicarbonate transport system substrate-binding protein
MSRDGLRGTENLQMTRRHLLQRGAVGAAALGTLGALGAGTARGAGGDASAETLNGLTVAISTGGVDTSPIFAGIDNGFYRPFGLDVKPQIVTTGGVGLIAAVSSGQAQVTPVGTAALYSSIAAGIPLKIIGIMHGTSVKKFYSTSYIVAGPRAGVGPRQIEKLKGKKIGLPLGTDGEAGLLSVLKQAGLDRGDVSLVNLRPPDLAVSLQTGAVDAISFVEPWPSVVLLKVPGAVRVSPPAPLFGPGVIVSSPDTIASKRKDLVNFLAATARSQQWARKNAGHALIDVIARDAGVDPDAARKAINYVRFDPRISKITLSRLAYLTIPTLISLGILKTGLDSRTAIDVTLNKEVQRKYPQYFSDLPRIPAKLKI